MHRFFPAGTKALSTFGFRVYRVLRVSRSIGLKVEHLGSFRKLGSLLYKGAVLHWGPKIGP